MSMLTDPPHRMDSSLPARQPAAGSLASGSPTAWVRVIPSASGETARARRSTRAADHRALIDLVARVTGIEAASLALRHRCPACGSSDHGRPSVDVGGIPLETVHVSVSRAAGMLAIAVALGSPIGIDIESAAAAARAGFDDVAFTEAELAALSSAYDALHVHRGPDADVAAAAPDRPAAGRSDTASQVSSMPGEFESHGPSAVHDVPAAIGGVDRATARHRMRAQAWAAKEAVLKASGHGLLVDPRSLAIRFGADGRLALGDSTVPGIHPAAVRLVALALPSRSTTDEAPTDHRKTAGALTTDAPPTAQPAARHADPTSPAPAPTAQPAAARHAGPTSPTPTPTPTDGPTTTSDPTSDPATTPDPTPDLVGVLAVLGPGGAPTIQIFGSDFE